MRLFSLLFLFLPSLANANETRWVDFPKNCLGKQYPCAVTHQAAGEWIWQDREMAVSAHTSLVLLDDKTVQLMSGDIWSQDFKELNLKHGIFQIKLSGDSMLNRRDQKLQVINLDGDVSVSKSGVTGESIPAGFSNWYEGLAQGGEFKQGVIAPTTSNDIALLFKKMPGSREILKTKLSSYKEHRKLALSESSKLYSKVTELRRVASENATAARENAFRRQKEEKARLRQMYRDKFYNP